MAEKRRLSREFFLDFIGTVNEKAKAELITAVFSFAFASICAAVLPFSLPAVTQASLSGSSAVLSALLLTLAFMIPLPLFTIAFVSSVKSAVGKCFPLVSEKLSADLYHTERNCDVITAEGEIPFLERRTELLALIALPLFLCIVFAVESACIPEIASGALIIVLLTFVFALLYASGKGGKVSLVPACVATCILAGGITVLTSECSGERLFLALVLLPELTLSSAVFLVLLSRLSASAELTENLRRAMTLRLKSEEELPVLGDVRLYDLSVGVSDIISGLNARFPQGEVTAVYGGAGKGKSHLYRLLKGEELCTKGYVMYGDSDIAVTNPALTARLTASAELSLSDGSLLVRMGYNKLGETKENFLKRLGENDLTNLYERYGEDNIPVSELSYEDRVRLAVAEARLRDPEILLINGLLDDLERDALSSVYDCLKKSGLTVIVFTSSEEIASLCSGRVNL